MLVLKVEDLGVAGGSRGDEFGVKELEDFVTNVGELRLNLGQKVPPKWVAIWVASPKWRIWCQNAPSKWVAIRFFWVAIWVLCVCVSGESGFCVCAIWVAICRSGEFEFLDLL